MSIAFHIDVLAELAIVIDFNFIHNFKIEFKSFQY